MKIPHSKGSLVLDCHKNLQLLPVSLTIPRKWSHGQGSVGLAWGTHTWGTSRGLSQGAQEMQTLPGWEAPAALLWLGPWCPSCPCSWLYPKETSSALPFVDLLYAGTQKIGRGPLGVTALWEIMGLIQGRRQWCPSLPAGLEPLSSPALERSAQYKKGFRSLRWIWKRKSWGVGSTVINYKALWSDEFYELKKNGGSHLAQSSSGCSHSFTTDLLHEIAQIYWLST